MPPSPLSELAQEDAARPVAPTSAKIKAKRRKGTKRTKLLDICAAAVWRDTGSRQLCTRASRASWTQMRQRASCRARGRAARAHRASARAGEVPPVDRLDTRCAGTAEDAENAESAEERNAAFSLGVPLGPVAADPSPLRPPSCPLRLKSVAGPPPGRALMGSQRNSRTRRGRGTTQHLA